MLCPKCSKEMRLVPAGVSKKTGKAYGAFYSCPDRECGTTAKLDTPVKKFEAGLDKDIEDKKWEKIRSEKTENIKWLNALNNATLLIAYGKVNDNPDIKTVDLLNAIALQIYRLPTPNGESHE